MCQTGSQSLTKIVQGALTGHYTLCMDNISNQARYSKYSARLLLNMSKCFNFQYAYCTHINEPGYTCTTCSGQTQGVVEMR